MDWGDVSFCDVFWLMDRCLTLSRAEPFCGRNTQLPNTTSYLYSGTPAQSEGQRESLCALQEGCTGLTCVPARAACSSSTEEEESCPLLAFLSDIAGTTLIFQMYFFYFPDTKQTGEGVPCAVSCVCFSLGTFVAPSKVQGVLDITEPYFCLDLLAFV